VLVGGQFLRVRQHNVQQIAIADQQAPDNE
jgi:hypothetical protein